jgi:hypothetical protein
MTTVREKLRDAVDRLTDAEARRLLVLIESGEGTSKRLQAFERLSSDPAFGVPALGLRTFRVVQPVVSKGLPASTMLIEDRR